MIQHVIANNIGAVYPNLFKSTLFFLSIIKIFGTYKYSTSLLDIYDSEIANWPDLCKYGQQLFIGQILLRFITEIISIINLFIPQSYKDYIDKFALFITGVDVVFTTLQLGIFLIQT